MLSLPKVLLQPAVAYMAITETIAMTEFDKKASSLLAEVYNWLAARDIAVAGPALLRHNFISPACAVLGRVDLEPLRGADEAGALFANLLRISDQWPVNFNAILVAQNTFGFRQLGKNPEFVFFKINFRILLQQA